MNVELVLLFIIAVLIFTAIAAIFQGFGIALIILIFLIYMDKKESKENK